MTSAMEDGPGVVAITGGIACGKSTVSDILAGMGVIAWMLWRAIRQDFDSNYFGPVDYVALYWHLVDLVWIYLFPLLYLI